MPVGWGPLMFNVSATIERIEHVPNERIVEQDSMGNLDIDVVQPSGTGTLLTHTSEWSSRTLLDRLQTLVVTRGRGLGRWLEEYLRLTKERAEA